ncbi:riboflavin biosynthesis protein RibD [Desulfurobacterium thermolithotrophum DSM 11699]|uniref:Riboflavin biosynthesis protein RibD n=1 Tax=Desulfurobacterium thermolithotrophum (strain DSM 11699 / BSA) TaxID=868864 RepID=F0S144_DESTD|nr:bifunctional diaminohydroxyphosphoribosylaminopyrimidine deaminase/5-amino-6-(5-phosphoribosylamino)uracil reductase RibD [Desulfurobacterium thermolithotrophum]ADY73922.1 riboflavin biosynthesis protein RibD [Desulfurobacterium thermolithotrophum DSM 11699]
MTQDEKFMKLAISEAYKAKGRTLPNPAVGAVIVKDGKVIATGYHERAGLPHAESVAISKAGEKAKGATLYVTLEPCNHYGKTPPCSEKIIKAGIKRVVVGIRDPNPVARGGVEKLKNAGIEVKVGVLEKECFELIDDFIVNLKEKRPFVSLKLAATLDGKIADYKGNSKWITSEESRKLVHILRSYHNAVMVGIGTVLKDDPLLNVRKVPADVQPKAIVVDPHLKIPLSCRLIKSRSEDLIIITTRESMLSDKALILKGKGVKLLEAGENSIELKIALEKLKGEFGIYSVMCEGGSKLAWSLLEGNLIDKFYLFYAPKILGGKGMSMFDGSFSIEDAHQIRLFSINSVSNDLLIKAYRVEAI